MVLTFDSEDEILWCEHSNESSFAVLTQKTFFLAFCKRSYIFLYHSILGASRQEFLNRVGLLWQENVSTDSECNFDNKFTNYISTLRISSVQLHVLNSFCQVALWWVLKVEVGEQVWQAVLDILSNTFIILIQCKQLTAKTSIWLKSGTEIASSSYNDIFSNMNLKYPLTQQVQSLPSSTKRIVLTVEVALNVNTTFSTVFT